MVDFYPKKINERFNNPKHTGLLKDATANAKWASFVCGVSLTFSIKIEGDKKKIVDAKFQTNACGYVIAAADLVAEKIVGQKLTQLHGLKEIENDIISEIGDVPESRQHCLDICFNAMQNALAEYRTSQIEEYTGEKALICTCFGVSEEEIEKLLKDKEIEAVDQIGDLCGAGTGCGSCQPLIQEIIDNELENY